MRHLIALASSSVLAFSACASPEIDPRTGDAIVVEEDEGLFSQAQVSPDSAIHLAKAAVPGRVRKGELEREDGALIYSFDIEVAGESGITEIHIDASTGEVLAKEHERG